jgi:hypothetical protein
MYHYLNTEAVITNEVYGLKLMNTDVSIYAGPPAKLPIGVLRLIH